MGLKIVAAAIRIGKHIITMPPPARHGDLMYMPELLATENFIEPKDQGFLTSEGQFVDRAEALKIALRGEQMRQDRPIWGHDLYSENLW